MNLSKLERAKSLATEAMYTVALQHRRIKTIEPEDEVFVMRVFVDLQFLILVLNRLQNAVLLLSEETETKDDITAMVLAFENALPHLKHLRNIIEHGDEYATGKGKNKKYLKDGVQVMSFDGETFIWFGKVYNVDTALRSAEILYSAFLDVVSRFHVNGVISGLQKL
jgi:hypothetical protein